MRNAKVVISILNMTLSHDKAEDENFCPLKDEEGCPATKFCHRAKPYILFWGKLRILGSGFILCIHGMIF